MVEILKGNQKLVIREACTEDAANINDLLRKIVLETEQFGFEPDELLITDE